MLSSEGSIDFNGEIVRKNRLESDINKNPLNHKKYSTYFSPIQTEHKKHSKKKSEGKTKSTDKKAKISKSKKKEKKLVREEDSREIRKSGMNTENTNYALANTDKSRSSFIMGKSHQNHCLPS